MVNRKHETSLTVKKTDQSGKVIAGATFTVQKADGQYAEVSNGAVTWQTEKETLSTNESGQIVLSGIPNGTYTVTEVSVPDDYLSTGFVTVGETTTQGVAGQALVRRGHAGHAREQDHHLQKRQKAGAAVHQGCFRRG